MVNQLNQSEYVRMIMSEGRYHPPSFSRPVNEKMNPMGGIFVVVLHGGHDFFRECGGVHFRSSLLATPRELAEI